MFIGGALAQQIFEEADAYIHEETLFCNKRPKIPHITNIS